MFIYQLVEELQSLYLEFKLIIPKNITGTYFDTKDSRFGLVQSCFVWFALLVWFGQVWFSQLCFVQFSSDFHKQTKKKKKKKTDQNIELLRNSCTVPYLFLVIWFLFLKVLTKLNKTKLTEPNLTKPDQRLPHQTKPIQTEPNQTKSNQTILDQTREKRIKKPNLSSKTKIKPTKQN